MLSTQPSTGMRCLRVPVSANLGIAGDGGRPAQHQERRPPDLALGTLEATGLSALNVPPFLGLPTDATLIISPSAPIVYGELGS